MKVIAAVFVSSIVLAGGAWAADTHSVGPTMAQFNALKAQVASLQKQNKTLILATGASIVLDKQLETFDKQCLNGWKSVKEYGGFNVEFNNNTTGTATALDWAATGDAPDGYLPLATADCTNRVP